MDIYKSAIAISILAYSLTNCPASPIINDGQKLAFLGDSITAGGADHPGGYARLVISGLEANGIKVSPVFAGVGGNKSNDMLARLDRDVLSHKPDFMTLSCGVNDVWHGPNGVPLDKYKENITAIVEKAAANNVKVVVLTSTMIGEDQSNPNNQKLIAYNEFLKQLAGEKHLPLADLNALMQESIEKARSAKEPSLNGSNYLTIDGVHMAPRGDQMMAAGILRALGLSDAQIAKAQAAWLDITASTRIQVNQMISLKDYNKLLDQAGRETLSLNAYVDQVFRKALEEQAGK